MTPILVISLMVFAIHYVFQEGEIFGIVQKIKLGKLADPLRDCPVCMVPYYGSIIYGFIFWESGWHGWVVTIIASLGLNAVLLKLMPDKESPTLHGELETISDRLMYFNLSFDEFKESKVPEKIINAPTKPRGGKGSKPKA